jgi:short-subunit dehydrogenase
MNIFITGASSGIGEALAREFAARGHRLGLVARRAPLLQELATSLPGKHFTYAADVNDAATMRDAGAQFDADCGGADIIIANAGISVGVLTEYFEDLQVFKDVLMTNVVAMAHTFHPFIAPMRARGRGQLVGVASVAGIRGLPGSEAYCASKAAAISYCESLRVELKKTGIHVTTICPGFVRTPLTAKNKYSMPFVMDAAPFAKKCADAIFSGTSYRVVPWQMGIAAKLLRVLPNWAFDKAFGNRPYKPRSAELTDR